MIRHLGTAKDSLATKRVKLFFLMQVSFRRIISQNTGPKQNSHSFNIKLVFIRDKLKNIMLLCTTLRLFAKI